MNAVVHFLVIHGIAVLFVAVLAEQANLPIPCVPVLLAVGSLGSLGRMNIPASIAVALVACLMADAFWYGVGRRSGPNPLRTHTERLLKSKDRMRFIAAALNHHGPGVLLLTKLLPGPNLVHPVAGILGLSPIRLLIFDTIASIVWAGGYITLGYIFSQRLQELAAYASRFGIALVVVMACILAVPAVRWIRHRGAQERIQSA